MLGLYEEFISHFFFCSIISVKSFQLKESYDNIILSPLLSQWNLKVAWKPSIKNWPCGKLSSSFDADDIKTSMYPLICSQRKSNLFLKELILRCPNINLLTLLTQISLRLLIVRGNCSWSIRDYFSFKNKNPLMS